MTLFSEGNAEQMSGKISGVAECYQHPATPNHSPEIGGLAAMADAHSTEVWKAIPTWEGRYEVSTLGRVRSLIHAPKILKQSIYHGYPGVVLSWVAQSRKRCVNVAVLVLETFGGPRPEGYECAHLNGNKDDSRFENLAWVTTKENCNHKRLHGTMLHGETSPRAKLTEAQVAQILASTESHADLGRRLGLGQNAIGNVRRRKSWTHVPSPESGIGYRSPKKAPEGQPTE